MAVDMSSDGLIASGGADRVVQLLDETTGSLHRSFSGHVGKLANQVAQLIVRYG